MQGKGKRSLERPSADSSIPSNSWCHFEKRTLSNAIADPTTPLAGNPLASHEPTKHILKTKRPTDASNMSSDAGSSGDNAEADGAKINKMPSRKPPDRKVTKEWPEVVSALHSLRLSALVESKTNSSSSSQVASLRDINISGSFDVSGIER
jgi:hypothetical protein